MRIDHAVVAEQNCLPAIAIACGAGARDPRCAEGPRAFRDYAASQLAKDGIALRWRDLPGVLCTPERKPLDAVAETARWSAGIVRELAARNERFLAIGGDHSCAVGVWSGAAAALRRKGPLGLIWIDAHLDMHTPETTHSGMINGMPVAALLGHGAPALTDIAGGPPALDPRHVCLVGARSFEPEEVAFAREHGVRVIFVDEMKSRGLAAAMAEARAIASRATAGYGVSLDLDAFDPAEAPGVGTPATDGIRAANFLPQWRALTRDPACLGAEIVELNPYLDEGGRTVRLAADLAALWAGKETRS